MKNRPHCTKRCERCERCATRTSLRKAACLIPVCAWPADTRAGRGMSHTCRPSLQGAADLLDGGPHNARRAAGLSGSRPAHPLARRKAPGKLFQQPVDIVYDFSSGLKRCEHGESYPLSPLLVQGTEGRTLCNELRAVTSLKGGVQLSIAEHRPHAHVAKQVEVGAGMPAGNRRHQLCPRGAKAVGSHHRHHPSGRGEE